MASVFFTPRFRRPAVLLLALVVATISGTFGAWQASAQSGDKMTTVILVRHAERASAPPQDPPLSEVGIKRSQELARLLSKAGVTAIFTSQFLRTKQTAEPLARSLGIPSTTIEIRMSPSNPREVSAESIREIADRARERPGATVLIVGHSNTIPEVIRALGGDAVPVVDEKEFDDLFVVTVPAKGTARVMRLKYGSQQQ